MTDRTPGGIAFLLIMFMFTVAGMAREEATPDEAIPVKLSLCILARVIGELIPTWLAQTVRDQP